MTVTLETVGTGRQLALGIIGRYKEEIGVDLLPIFTDPDLGYREKRRRGAIALYRGLLTRAAASPHARDWGLHTAADVDAAVTRFATDDVNVQPNIAITSSNVQIIAAYQGQAVKDYLNRTTIALQNMSKATSPRELAAEMVGGALVGVGVSMVTGAIRALFGGASLIEAVTTGVTSVGMGTAIGAVALALVALLLWLVLEIPKNMLGLVINNTDAVFVVDNWRVGANGGTPSNLFMNHGSMSDFMDDSLAGDLSTEVQINARVMTGTTTVCYAGLYYAEKNAGFYGSEGLVVFTPTPANSGPIVAHQFACPYSNDNGTNIEILAAPPTDLPGLFQQLYNTRQVRVTASQSGYNLTSTVNDASGGITCCIASISHA